MQDRRLAELVGFARARSPFYRRLYADLPAGPARLTDLPILDHTAFWQANTVHDNQLLTGPLVDGIVYMTGGTTQAPRMSVYTRAETVAVARIWAQGLATAGVRPGDRVANLFYVGEMYASFIHNLFALQEMSIPAVHLPIGGSAAPGYTAHTLEDLGATVVIGPTTTLCRLAAHIVEGGRPLGSVDLLLFAGEAFYGDQRALLTQAFPRARVNSLGYASIDGGMLGGPIAGGADPREHRVFRPDTLLEIVDVATGEPITQPGRPGRVVTTDLIRRLMPVIRYPVGDLAEWVDVAGHRFRLLGRAGEGARVGPVTVYLDDVHGLVESVLDGSPTAGLQLVLRRREAKDELVLRIAAEPSDPDAFGKELAEGLDRARPMFAEHVRDGLIQPLVVEWVTAAGLASNGRTGKLIPLVDERDTR
jgi:phenylacetate-CoA ligase